MLFLTGVFTYTLTVVNSLGLLIFNCYVLAVAMGGVDNIVQILLIARVKHGSEAYMQALHGGFALGAFISPVIISGFVGELAQSHQSGEIGKCSREVCLKFFSCAP